MKTLTVQAFRSQGCADAELNLGGTRPRPWTELEAEAPGLIRLRS